ncbi:acyl-homoserine-lactone synthase [Pseudomonas asuensis]
MKLKFAQFRYKIFVEKLGWEINEAFKEEGLEQDEFDRDDTAYIYLLTEHNDVVAYARLLPTTSEYLLGNVFPFLCDAPPPRSCHILEISRYVYVGKTESSAAISFFRNCLLFAKKMGATDVVAVTSVGLERLFERNGIETERLGGPKRYKGEMLVGLKFPLKKVQDCNNTIEAPVGRFSEVTI